MFLCVLRTVFDCRNRSKYYTYECLSATTFCPFKGAAEDWQFKRILFQMWWLYGPFSGVAIVLRCVSKPENVRWESLWGREWMCWCLEVNIQYPTLRVLHVWISLSEQSKAGTGRDRKGWSQRQETGRQKERLKAVKLQPERSFQKTIFIPPFSSLPLDKAREGWRCVSAAWSLGLLQICSQSVVLASLQTFFFFLNVLNAGWRFM